MPPKENEVRSRRDQFMPGRRLADYHGLGYNSDMDPFLDQFESHWDPILRDYVYRVPVNELVEDQTQLDLENKGQPKGKGKKNANHGKGKNKANDGKNANGKAANEGQANDGKGNDGKGKGT